MKNALTTWWRKFKSGAPGRRFQDHYDSMHHARLDARRRIQFTVLALILIAAGIAFGFVPGIPGFILVLFGAAFIATQSRAVARGLDWFEIHLRRMMRHS